MKKKILKFTAYGLCLVFVLTFGVLCFKREKIVSCSGIPTAVNIPIIMYHQVMKTDSRSGKYVISLTNLERDLQFLQSKGYTTVDCEDLINYVYYAKPLPEKSIVLSFDDGFESVYALVAPLMEKYHMCCICDIIGSVSDSYSRVDDHNLSYSYMTWDEIATLGEGTTVEIHNHSYDMHHYQTNLRKGLSRKPGESEEDYRAIIRRDLTLCQQRIQRATGKAPTAMVYPYGLYNETSESLIKQLGFLCSFTCEEHINKIVCGNPQTLYKLGRYNRPGDISTEEFFKRML